MKIGAIIGKMTHLNIVGKVELKNDEPKPYKKHAIARISDETGKIWLVLWNEQVDQVEVSDTILLLNAFTRPDGGRYAVQTWQTVISKVSRSDLQKIKKRKIWDRAWTKC